MKSYWFTCETCEASLCIEQAGAVVPDPDEWHDPFPSCPVCGDSMIGPNGDEDTQRDIGWHQGRRAERASAQMTP